MTGTTTAKTKPRKIMAKKIGTTGKPLPTLALATSMVVLVIGTIVPVKAGEAIGVGSGVCTWLATARLTANKAYQIIKVFQLVELALKLTIANYLGLAPR